MSLGRQYPALANTKERGQFATLDERIREIDMRLAQLNSFIGGNFKTGATIFSTKEKPMDINEARDNRFALAERAKVERQQLEQQKASLVRQRAGMEGAVQQRRLGTAAAMAAKLPPMDKALLDQMKNHPEDIPNFLQEAEAGILNAIQNGEGAEKILRESTQLKTVAALADNLQGVGSYSDSVKAGDLELGPSEKRAMAFIQQNVPKYLIQSGAIKLPTQLDASQVSREQRQGALNDNPALAAQLQDSYRREAPMPQSIDSQPGTSLEDKLNFAAQGPAPDPGAGRQFVFTGHGGSITAGTAPAGSANPFAAMQRDPALEQRIMQRDISYKPIFSPDSPTPSTPQQGAPLEPKGPVTNPAAAPPSPPALKLAPSGVPYPNQGDPFGLAPLASMIGRAVQGPAPLQSIPQGQTPERMAAMGYNVPESLFQQTPAATPAPQGQAAPAPQQVQQEELARMESEAEQYAINLMKNGYSKEQIEQAVLSQFPALSGL